MIPKTCAFTPSEVDEPDGLSPISDKLVEDLIYHRTASLQDQLADQPGMAVSVIAHALALRKFYGPGTIPVPASRSKAPRRGSGTASPIGGRCGPSPSHDRWARQLPRDSGDLLGWITDQDGDAMLSLLAYCVAARSMPRRHQKRPIRKPLNNAQGPASFRRSRSSWCHIDQNFGRTLGAGPSYAMAIMSPTADRTDRSESTYPPAM